MRPARPLAVAAVLAVTSTFCATSASQAEPTPAPTDQPAQGARAAQPGFRVLPYLQRPAADSMTINWVSELDTPGELRLESKGSRGKRHPQVFRSTRTHEPLLDYTEKELDQSIAGLEKGSWLKSNANYKHSVRLDRLKPDTTYSYTVTQDGKTFTAEFSTAPKGHAWDDVRIIAFSDSETEPMGRVEHREWELSQANPYTDGSGTRPGEGSQWDQKFGNATRYGQFTLRYPLSQDAAMKANLGHIEAADPDLLLVAGDLAQGSGYQPGWDEFFGYFAGEHGSLASRTPLIPALGNWETFAAINGGYGTDEDRSPAVTSRNKYHVYMDTWGDPRNPQYKDSYHRVDHGPVTVITLDSTNGIPDEDAETDLLSGEKFSGDDTNLNEARRTTDTQGEFTEESYDQAYAQKFGGTSADSDLPNFNPGTQQWAWAERQLRDARAKGQIIVVQWHHAAYSNGVHGTPPNHEHPDNQSGVAMRVYTPLLEKYDVATVISGHDEMFERSFVDSDGDGRGFMSYDVGVAADGLRGEQYAQKEDGTWAPIRFNSHSEWSASADEPETWGTDANGVPQLVDGGLHYGHLQMDFTRTRRGAELTLTPVYLFPILDSEYNLVRTERRVYDDVVKVQLDKHGRVVR